MPQVVFMCGPAGSGESTVARLLEAQGRTRLSYDQEAWNRGLRVMPLIKMLTTRSMQTCDAAWSSSSTSGSWAITPAGLEGPTVRSLKQDGSPKEVSTTFFGANSDQAQRTSR